MASYLVADYPFKIIDLVLANFNLIALAQNGSSSFLIKINTVSGTYETIRTFAPFLQGRALSYRNNTLAVTGINGSGPTVTGSPWLPYNAHQIWLHTNQLNDDPPVEKANVALTNIVQNIPIIADSTFIDWAGYYRYSMSGGQFSIEVKNLGETILKSVDVQIGFGWLDNFICASRPVNKKHFSGLSLLPGESRWLDFGDVLATQQSQIPTQLCFWTSAPNHKPDAEPTDDVNCKIITFSVNTKEPGVVPFSVVPNPANESIRISFSEMPVKGFWKMYDMTGRQVKAGEMEAGMSDFNINTAALVPGLYLLWINGSALKVVIAH